VAFRTKPRPHAVPQNSLYRPRSLSGPGVESLRQLVFDHWGQSPMGQSLYSFRQGHSRALELDSGSPLANIAGKGRFQAS
jgi:hypothetical protein